MRKRITTPEERALFEEKFRETSPLAAEPAAKKTKAKAGASGGLDGNTADRLRRGLLEPQARLDLHGMTEVDAHRALLMFLRSAHVRGMRLVLVVTGKGRPRAPDAPFDLELETRGRGILKSAVPRWLKEPGLAAVIATTQWSHRRHGGDGALYVYLRKR